MMFLSLINKRKLALVHWKQSQNCNLFFCKQFLAYYAKLYNRAARFVSKKVESR